MRLQCKSGQTRRHAMVALASLSLGATGVRAQSPVGQPFQTLSPPITEDRRKVVEFFSYVCPVCQRMHKGLASWAKTLPKSMTFESVAIPISSADLEEKLLLFRAAVSIVHPSLVAAWDDLVFDDLYAGQNNVVSIVRRAAQTLRIDINGLIGLSSQATVSRVVAWVDRAKSYRVRVTPTIAVAGLYTASPDALDEREDLFPMLLNGLVSRSLP